ncbi:AMP-binding protein [Nocardia donostiensis]|uniref:Long-chain fatty acid--CoA ligase n=1 Tax=Nocardia donostiensis TaxID=1538463 RepID=A0A1W0BAT8_9NOCA|nr:AMP-binding protein [Nocardia donostiensis]ONM46796.1 long-chain fatty acid--CoA ligase [Nocardia donostiensis]OQS16270.1 long-chain fatty acid--CoA ligase [Nocardia donostiensis]OQS19584.1 long-chain fatty acid--CoA ligase [Nocardia donostiensis]
MKELTESWWPKDTSRPILDITVGRLLQQAAAEAPDKLAVVSVAPEREARTWTYRELLDDAEHAAAWLLDRFQPGEHVGVWAPNVPEWLVLQYGAALSGLVLVAANPALRGAELEHALGTSHAAGVFFVDSFRGTDMAALVRAVLPTVPAVREAVAFEGWLDEVRRTDKRAELPVVDPRAATQIQFTSGTTGHAKAALLTHRAMVTNASFVRDRCGATPGATFATALPLFHTAGCGLAGMGSVHQRATLVIAEVFDPTTMLTAMQDYRAEVFGGVPTMLHSLLAHPDLGGFDLSALQVVMSGGDAVPPALVDGWAKACGAATSAVYGQTELSPIVCQTRPTDSRDDNMFTAGQPLPHVEVSIRDPSTGEIAPIGVEGEICARGYQQMIGYLDMPAETAQTIDADGWLHTGDLGTMDARGYVRVTGRLKDMIIRGGENIYPREIEEVLAAYPAVTAAIVLGLPDTKWGEKVVAVVRLDPAQPAPSSAELHDYLRERLAPHKTPKSWYVTDSLPVSSLGKVQKFRLRDQIITGELRPL